MLKVLFGKQKSKKRTVIAFRNNKHTYTKIVITVDTIPSDIG